MSSCEPECICCCLPCVVIWGSLYFTYTGIISAAKYCRNNSSRILRCQCCRSNPENGDEIVEDPDLRAEDTPRPSSDHPHHDQDHEFTFSEKRRRSRDSDEMREHLHEEDAARIQQQPVAAKAMVIQLPPKAMSPPNDRDGSPISMR